MVIICVAVLAGASAATSRAAGTYRRLPPQSARAEGDRSVIFAMNSGFWAVDVKTGAVKKLS